MPSKKLSHLDEHGNARMVDVGHKADTQRAATALGEIRMRAETLEKIAGGHIKKGDVLTVARVAAIQAAKKTSDLIPMCHPIPIVGIKVDILPVAELPGLQFIATVKSTGKTGVEMEALTAVSVGLLTIYDMAKAVDKAMVIEGIHLALKDGGKSGRYEAVAK